MVIKSLFYILFLCMIAHPFQSVRISNQGNFHYGWNKWLGLSYILLLGWLLSSFGWNYKQLYNDHARNCFNLKFLLDLLIQKHSIFLFVLFCLKFAFYLYCLIVHYMVGNSKWGRYGAVMLFHQYMDSFILPVIMNLG